jgi:hypothetical protein
VHWWQSLLGESFIIVVFIAASAFIAWLIELSSRQHWNEETGTHKHQTETNEIANEKRTSAGITEEQSSTAKPRSDDTEYKETYAGANLYLATQIVIATVAAIGIPVAICSLLSLNKSVKAANQQAEAAATQARTAQREFELSERPWVYTDPPVISQDLTYDATGLYMTIRFVLRNVGHSPAAGVQVELNPYLIDDPQYSGLDFITELQKVCAPVRKVPSNIHAPGFTVFPNQPPIVFDEIVSIGAAAINRTFAARRNDRMAYHRC